MIFKVLCLSALVACALAGITHHYGGTGGTSSVSREQDHHGYRFRYDIHNPHGGSNGQEESGDDHHRRGSYYIDLPQDHSRVDVHYSDDGHGLQSSVREQRQGLSRYSDSHGREMMHLQIHHDAPRYHHQEPIHHIPQHHYGF